MQLYFRDVNLGEVTEEGQDFPWQLGTLTPNANIEAFRAFFNHLTDEEQTEDPPFAHDLLDDSNWSMVSDSGVKRGIMVPAVHPDNSIWWVWTD
jgi:hypothetical protein